MICQRYPGRRPSDYYGELDSYQAFQLDAAMAFKGKAGDNDYNQMMLWTILESVRGLMMVMGGKPKKLPKPKPTIVPPKEKDDLPSVEEVLNALGNSGTVMQQSK